MRKHNAYANGSCLKFLIISVFFFHYVHLNKTSNMFCSKMKYFLCSNSVAFVVKMHSLCALYDSKTRQDEVSLIIISA